MNDNKKIRKPNSDVITPKSPDALIKHISTLIDEAKNHVAREYFVLCDAQLFFFSRTIHQSNDGLLRAPLLREHCVDLCANWHIYLMFLR